MENLEDIANGLTKEKRVYLVSIKGWRYADNKPSTVKSLLRGGLLEHYRGRDYVCISQKGRLVREMLVEPPKC